MYVKATEMIHVRVTAKQLSRMRECSKYLGKPMTEIARDAILDKLDIVEARMKKDDEDRKPRGLNLAKKTEPDPTPATSPPPPPTPTIDEFDRLVLFVADASGDKQEQDRRINSVLQIITSTSTSLAETEEVLKKLDERVKKLAETRAKDPLYGMPIPGLGEK